MRDLHELPKFQDGLSYLFVEHCKIEQDKLSIALFDASGKTPIPCASLALLMLGPGTSITHAAIHILSENGCMIVWVGEEGIRFYAQGSAKTRHARNIILQAYLVSNSDLRLEVVKNMYRIRFDDNFDPNFTIQQLRGMEGIRVKKAYAQASKETGVNWQGRNYDRNNWNSSDPINKALSAANASLYGICHVAILAAGYSPALGFIHTGKQLSFVYDIADLYKADLTIPLAFRLVQESSHDVARRVRQSCRDMFHDTKLLTRIIPDIHSVLNVPETQLKDSEIKIDTPDNYLSELNEQVLIKSSESETGLDFDSDQSAPGNLWDPKKKIVKGGQNFSD